MSDALPMPANELQRVLHLSEFEFDYSSFENNFADLAKLAAKVAGTHISLVNLVDSLTQWTISKYGFEVEQMPRDETVCQYTLTQPDHFEVTDLSKDERFKDQSYVKEDPSLRYYYGIPLKSDGHNIGALCVLDDQVKTLTPEKTELLKIIAEEIVNRLKAYKAIESLRNKVAEVKTTQNKVVHDIRGPLAGIIGLAEIMSAQGKQNNMDEVLEFVKMIHKSGKSILELADEILGAEKKNPAVPGGDELTLELFKEKLEKLYFPQATSKSIEFTVNITPQTAKIAFAKNKLLQIAGNLISNAIKFTPQRGSVTVDLDLAIIETGKMLKISVTDSGTGLNQEKIKEIMNGGATSSNGTHGEQGYGFGLALVKQLVTGLDGAFNIESAPGEGATFEVVLFQGE